MDAGFAALLSGVVASAVTAGGLFLSTRAQRQATEGAEVKSLWDECHRLRQEVETTRVSYNALLARIAPLEGLKERYDQVKEENAELKSRVVVLEEANRNNAEDKRLLKECEKCTTELRIELERERTTVARLKDDLMEQRHLNDQITQFRQINELTDQVEANTQKLQANETEERL